MDNRVQKLDYRLFDCDNHYYEAEDAFLRYLDPAIEHNAPRWVQMESNGQRRLLFGDRMNRFMGADHTFSKVGRPGVFSEKGPGDEGQLRRARRLPARVPRARARVSRGWTRRASRRRCCSRRSRSASSSSSSTTSPRRTRTCTPSTAGSTTTGASTTRTASTASRWCRCSIPLRAVDELEFVLERNAPVVLLRAGPVGGSLAGRPDLRPLLEDARRRRRRGDLPRHRRRLPPPDG